jgi:hypothetical protein
MKEKKEREVDDNRSLKKNLSTGVEETAVVQLCRDYNSVVLQKLQQRNFAKIGSRVPEAMAKPCNLPYLLLFGVCPTTLDTYLLPALAPALDFLVTCETTFVPLLPVLQGDYA